jgi:hypothetical protein
LIVLQLPLQRCADNCLQLTDERNKATGGEVQRLTLELEKSALGIVVVVVVDVDVVRTYQPLSALIGTDQH